MRKLLVLYYSKHGSTKLLAENIAIGAQTIGVEVLIRTVPPVTDLTEYPPINKVPDDGHVYVTKQDLVECDGLALGSPTHFGNMAAPMKYFIDGLSDLWLKGSLINKPACVFTSSSSLHGGQESTLLSMMLPLFHLGMCIVGLPYSEPQLHDTETGGTPYGASHVQTNSKRLSDDEIELAKAMGARLAEMAIKLG